MAAKPKSAKSRGEKTKRGASPRAATSSDAKTCAETAKAAPEETGNAICSRPGCTERSWNGLPGQFCSGACQQTFILRQSVYAFAVSTMSELKTLVQDVLDLVTSLGGQCVNLLVTCVNGVAGWIGDFLDRWCIDPIDFDEGPMPDAGIIAFYFPGYPTRVDRRCKATFLGNFYARSLQIRSCGCPSFASFNNAEAAFQSLKYWDQKQCFQNTSGEGAFQVSRHLRESEPMDHTYGGHGSNWAAMLYVLHQKFQDPVLRKKLLATSNAFLLEHNPTHGRDNIWSNNNDGSGKNWLGLQLMLVRDSLQGDSRWTAWLRQHVNLSTGETMAESEWPDLVLKASAATLWELNPHSHGMPI